VTNNHLYGRGSAENSIFKEVSLNRVLISLAAFAALVPLAAAGPPTMGDRAPDFKLATPEGKTVQLSEMTAKGPVVLVVLRGYPGYQCPYCNRQVQDFIQKAQGFADAGAHVVLVYPGPSQDLGDKANEFLNDKKLPDNFTLVLDPGYEFTNLYGLRWDAPHETAYPSTFLIDRQGSIFFSKIVKEHGGRTTAAEVLDALPKPKPQ
jgi:thioredoxin-dependent peroxiredoxin